MSISIKVIFALLVGAVLGSIASDILQQQLIFSIYYADHIDRRFMLAGAIGTLLGAATMAAFVLSKSKENSKAAGFAMTGAILSLVWLSIDRYSQLSHWWKFRPANQHSFQYWNIAKNPFHEFLADALIFNGVPLLWSFFLLWWGFQQLKRIRSEHVSSQNRTTKQEPPFRLARKLSL